MSYDISNAIDDAEEHRAALEKIRAVYPNAQHGVLPNGQKVWTNHSITPTGIAFVASAKERDVHVCPYEDVGPVKIFSSAPATRFANVWASDIAQKHPELLAKLIETL